MGNWNLQHHRRMNIPIFDLPKYSGGTAPAGALNSTNSYTCANVRDTSHDPHFMYRRLLHRPEIPVDVSSSRTYISLHHPQSQLQQQQPQLQTAITAPFVSPITSLPPNASNTAPLVMEAEAARVQRLQLQLQQFQYDDRDHSNPPTAEAQVVPAQYYTRIIRFLPWLFPRNPLRKPNSVAAKVVVLLLLMYSIFVLINAHGLVLMVNGILGIFLGAEGIHNTITCNLADIRNFIIFQALYFVISIVSELFSISTVTYYCDGSLTKVAQADCLNNTPRYANVSIITASVIIPIIILVFSIFYISLHRYYDYTNFSSNTRRRGMLQQFLRATER
uniref:Uncharacterized protein n=1 Tax=Lygus hesperus TaxID=30085 RepID=A0A0A9XAY6_LYGHE